jgi:glycosyltransferase involved in cell wall biosynthesis
MPQLGRLKEAVRPYYLRWVYFPLRPGQRPHAFRSCWDYPFQRLGESSLLPASSSGRPDLLFYPMTDWHTRIQRTQQLVRAFARLGFRCVYINPHLGREFESTPLFDRAHRLARLEENIFELHVRLPQEPVFHDRLLTPPEEDIIAAAVKHVLPADAKVVQILSFPLWRGVARGFQASASWPVVYDCHDLLSGFQNICADMITAEADLLREADLVLFSSAGLRDRYPEVRKALLVRNAVDASQFEAVRREKGACPVVGYVGALDSWFDIEAVEQSALQNPHCRFVIAGRIEFEPIRRLKVLPNVELMGEIPYSQVPELLCRLDAALIPFCLNPLTLMTNPVKLYEYFSCGLPVVSTPLPEAEAMGELVYIGRTATEFGQQVSRALSESDGSRSLRRQEIARQESWTARALTIGGLLAGI